MATIQPAWRRELPREADATAEAVERRAVLRRFGAYAAFTAPALTVLMASRQSEAGGFSRNSAHNMAATVGGGGGGPVAAVVADAASPADTGRPMGSPGRGTAPAILFVRIGAIVLGVGVRVLQIVSFPVDDVALVAAPATGAVAVVDATARVVLEGLRDGQAESALVAMLSRGYGVEPAGAVRQVADLRRAWLRLASGASAAPASRRRNRSSAARRSTRSTRSVCAGPAPAMAPRLAIWSVR